MNAPENRDPLRVHVGCSIIYESTNPTAMLLAISPGYNHLLIDQQRTTSPELAVHDYIDGFGNQIWRLVAPIGALTIDYHAIAEVSPLPDLVRLDLPQTPVENLPDDVLVYTLSSRYSPADLFTNEAWQLFGHIGAGSAQVQAVCDWLHSQITYEKGSTSATSAWDAYQQGRGVCRDFAHLGVAFCRALNFPARYVCGYLPDIGVPVDPTPMDFHAWFEVYMDGLWFTFDARHNRPRIGRVVIARGRDAADVAFSTIYGNTQLINLTVWADQVDEKFRLSGVS